MVTFLQIAIPGFFLLLGAVLCLMQIWRSGGKSHRTECSALTRRPTARPERH